MKASQVEIGKSCRYENNTYARIDAPGDKVSLVDKNFKLIQLDLDTEVTEPWFWDKGMPQTENDEAIAGWAIDCIKRCNDVGDLSIILPWWHERMKEVAAKTLKPGTDEIITDLHMLDHIWDVRGDYSMSVGKKYHPRAIDYYLGRRVKTNCGEGVLVRFAKEPIKWFDQKELFISETFVNRGYSHGISVKYPCTCGKVDYNMFAIPGIHSGAFGYLISESFEQRLDIRNHCMTCDGCESKVKSQLDQIESGAFTTDDEHE